MRSPTRWGVPAAALSTALLLLAAIVAACSSTPPPAPAPAPSRPVQRPETPPEWTRTGHCAAAIGPRIYILGGISPDPQSATRVDCLDTRLGQWSRLADMPAPRVFAAAVAIADKLYLVGGLPSPDLPAAQCTADLACYDPITDRWSSCRAMPTPRSRLAAVALDGRLFAIGGLIASDKHAAADSDAVEEYDPLRDQWRALPPLRKPRHALAACVAQGRIWALGGCSARSQFQPCRDVESMLPLYNTWRPEPPMSAPRAFFAALTIRDAIYALGAAPHPERLDPDSKTWTPLHAPDAPGRRMAMATVSGLVYVFGGEGEELDREAKFVRIFDPEADRWVE